MNAYKVMCSLTSIMIMLFSSHCSRTRFNTQLNNAEASEPDIVDCSSTGFTETSVMQIYSIDNAFVVPEIRGRIKVPDGWPMEGVVFEMRKKTIDWKNQQIFRTVSDKKGEFYIKGVKEGLYCFKATLEGWQSPVGEILVSKNASKDSTIEIEMYLAF